MVDHVQWPRPRIGEPNSPFITGTKQRPLRVTFHDSGLISLSAEEREALNILRELSFVSDIDALTIYAGEPVLVPDRVDASPVLRTSPILIDHESNVIFHTNIPSQYVSGRGRDRANITTAAICKPEQWLGYALTLTAHTDAAHPGVQMMYNDLLDAEVHRELRRDILITTSPRLLDNRERPLLKPSNLMRPSEAVRLVGLFLRSRDNYAYSAHRHGVSRVNRGLFYRNLAWYRLPHMWAYVGACMQGGDASGDDTATLGHTILTRMERALQERDDIGFQFYIPQNNDTRDSILRHFDNLTINLSGAFDVQALVAYRAYNIVASSMLGKAKSDKAKEKLATFRNEQFQKALNDAGAAELHNLIVGQRFQDVSRLLSLLRNTIHKAQLTAIAYEDRSSPYSWPQQSLVSVPQYVWQDLWDATERQGGAERWGLVALFHHTGPTQINSGAFEPYAFALALVEECFELIDAVAVITDTAGIFPAGHPIPQIDNKPPDDPKWRQFDILG